MKIQFTYRAKVNGISSHKFEISFVIVVLLFDVIFSLIYQYVASFVEKNMLKNCD